MSTGPKPAILDLTTVGSLKNALHQLADGMPLTVTAGGSRMVHAVLEVESGELHVACAALTRKAKAA